MRDSAKLEIAVIKKLIEQEKEKGERTKTKEYMEGFNDCLAVICSAFELRV